MVSLSIVDLMVSLTNHEVVARRARKYGMIK